ncbi:MAG: hypothetical protein HOJ16_06345 [Candidatus Peribacter sp.]|nr:hypothetical protein [Candidatus Peribacter sp.]
MILADYDPANIRSYLDSIEERDAMSVAPRMSVVEKMEKVWTDTQPTPEDPKPTLEELQAQVRSGLLTYHKRGGDAEGLILETIEVQLKSNEMTVEQCVMMLNNKEVQ